MGRRPQAYTTTYGVFLRWISFEQYNHEAAIEQAIDYIAAALEPRGCAIIAGPPGVKKAALRAGLFPEAVILLAETPGVRMLRTILPSARIRPDVFLYLFSKTRP